MLLRALAAILRALQSRTYAVPPPMTAADWRAGRTAAALIAADTRHRIALAAWRRRVVAEANAGAADVASADDSAQWGEVWRRIAN